MKNLIELHCHLDGSLDVITSYNLAKDREIISKDMNLEDFKKLMTVSSDNASLEEFLSCFKLPISLLQDKEALSISTLNIIKNLDEDGVIYAEIRFAPQFHTQKGLSQEQVVKAVLEGVKEASSIYKNVKVNIILCMMRSTPSNCNNAENIETVNIAKKFLNKGVCAIDLAGAEKDDLHIYKPLFDYVKELNIPFIMHAGEENYPNNVELAIEYGANRIGHGGHVLDDEVILNKLIESKIPLEMCVTSNVQCKNQPSFEGHALRKLFDCGVNVTINTDNRTLSDTTLNEEIDKVKKYMNFSDKEIIKMMTNAVNGGFLTEGEKEEIFSIFSETDDCFA